MAVILDGKKLRDKLLDELHLRTAKFDKKPKLVVILVGDNPASVIYVNNKRKFAEKAGIKRRQFRKRTACSVTITETYRQIEGYQYDFPDEGC